MSDHPREHHAHLGTGNGLVQFVCCARTERPFDALWVAPDASRGAANVFYSPRQSYDMVVQHLTADLDPATLAPILEAAEQSITQVAPPESWMRARDDMRPAIEHLARHLEAVTISIVER